MTTEGTTRAEAAAHILARETGRRMRAVQTRIDEVEEERKTALDAIASRLVDHEQADERQSGLIDGLRLDLGTAHEITAALDVAHGETRDLTAAQALELVSIAERLAANEQIDSAQDAELTGLTGRIEGLEVRAPVPGPPGPKGPAGPSGRVAYGGGGGSATIQSAGTLVANRPILNFVSGATVTDDSTNNRVNITVSGGGGGGTINSVSVSSGLSITGTSDLTITNTGVRSLAGSGISVSDSTGAVTITAASVTAGTGITVAGSGTTALTVSATGVTSVTAGNGITVTGTTTPTIAASIAAGTGVSIAGTTTLTVSATGVNSVSAGTGISVSGTTALTVSATGVQSLTAGNGISISGTTTPTVSASLAAGTGIGISGTTTLSVSNTGVTSIVAGTGISVSGATGAVTVTSSGGGGPTQVTFAESTASPNATVYVDSMTAAGATTNADLALRPKGTGALTAHVADSTATGGNKRGANAVDWQTSRSNAARVASGAQSTVSGGTNNTASGDQATVGGGSGNLASGTYQATVGGGSSNTASGTEYSTVAGGGGNTASASTGTIAGGKTHTASGLSSTVSGGEVNTASGSYSTVPGGFRGKAELYGKFAYAAGRFGNDGDAQFALMVLRGITSDAATAKILTADAATASATTTVVLRNNGVYAYRIELVANSAAVGSGFVYGTWGGNWSLSGLIRRTATAATTTLIGTPSVTAANIDSAISACAVTLTANTTLGGLAITVNGVALTNIRWVAVVTTTEVTG